MYGRGLRSIRTRFTLLVALCTAAGVAAMLLLSASQVEGGALSGLGLFLAGLAVAASATVTFVLAGQLTANIRALKASTDAIVAGDINTPVQVDCQCEVGGLADSFRKMANRLNSNILRMNVLAYHDGVTGYANRAVVEHVLAQALESAETPMPLALLFIDLDGFKTVNDTLGHSAGDELLRLVADRIVEEALGMTRDTLDSCTTAYGELCGRPPQHVVFSRFAGDEFVAILPGIVAVDAIEATCARVHQALSRPFQLQAGTVIVGASIGVARAPADSQSSAELLVDADMAMYAAKDQGRGRTVFFDLPLREMLVERSTLESELRHALEVDQFIVHFQPKFDTRTLALAGCEALVRWQHPTRGLISPGQFLDIAEQKNLMCNLGGLVFAKVVKQMKLWQAQGLSVPVAVNVSPSQFKNPELCNRIRTLLETNAIDPRLIEIEITEQAAMADSVAAGVKLNGLRALGVKLVIDDFGIGYSNLTQLVNMPFDVLKIDKSLVDDIGSSQRSEVVIESLVHLARCMGQVTVAEGVERREQLDFLRGAGCDLVQGFYLARPAPADQLQLMAAREPLVA